jgi:predicted RNase H-like HicB family nuclease
MEVKDVSKQIMDFSKRTLDSTFDAIIAVQKQTEKIAVGAFDKSPWLREEGKKAITEWLTAYQKGIEGIKTATDKNYDMMVAYFSKGKESLAEAEEEAQETIEKVVHKTKRHGAHHH